MNKALYIILFLLAGTFLVPASLLSQNEITEGDGVNWRKTLRIQGVFQPIDPYRESSIYSLSDVKDLSNIEVSSEYILAEQVASKFWYVFRDSLLEGFRKNKLNVYLIEQNRVLDAAIYEKGLKVGSLPILRDSMYAQVTEKIIDVRNIRNTRDRFIYTLSKRQLSPSGTGAVPAPGVYNEIRNDPSKVFNLFNLFELEMTISVDETGFKITPHQLIFSVMYWNNNPLIGYQGAGAQRFNFALEDELYTHFEEGASPQNPGATVSVGIQSGVGFLIDFKESLTQKFLVENGIKLSGETNVVPYYSLVTQFHYPFTIYAESDNVIAENWALTDYGYAELRKLIKNRYNELTYNFLYGQTPEWWKENKGDFTNGMYDLPEDKTVNQNQQQQ
jgi:hypothetical protein